MIKKKYYIYISLFSIFFIISACSKKRPHYYVSEIPNINKFEEYDHKACIDLKLNFDNQENIESKLYWNCRLSFSKFHLETNPILPRQIEFNTQLSDLIAKISLKVSRNQQNFLQQEIEKIDRLDHFKCLSMGYNLDDKNQIKIEEYYLCRKNLIELNYSEPPFGNEEYAKYQNKSYNISYIIDKKISDSMKRNLEKIEKNPDCKKYHPDSIDFEKCVRSIEDYKKCLNDGNIIIKTKENNFNVTCQKQAYHRFSDDMIKKNERNDLEILNRNLNSDSQNKNSFESIGINEKDFKGKSKEIIEKEKQEINPIFLNDPKAVNNSFSDIYSKEEISRLRKKFILNCTSLLNREIRLDKEALSEKCEKIKY
jgi:hypothetical protein